MSILPWTSREHNWANVELSHDSSDNLKIWRHAASTGALEDTVTESGTDARQAVALSIPSEVSQPAQEEGMRPLSLPLFSASVCTGLSESFHATSTDALIVSGLRTNVCVGGKGEDPSHSRSSKAFRLLTSIDFSGRWEPTYLRETGP